MNTSEWVSVGHPDKIADYISCYLLDRYLERDPDTRFAVEVQIKDKFVTLGGEVTSKAWFTHEELERSVHEAVAEIGYTEEYRDKWGGDNTIYDEEIEIAYHLSQQSPDIARGVDRDGWGDQGIFWGMAVNDPKTGWMPHDHYMARFIGALVFANPYSGLDVKTLVSVSEPGRVSHVVVAAPCRTPEHEALVRGSVEAILPPGTPLVLNGTGRYVRHGPIGDCGTTGRKLAVDFYGGNCRIGGGSPWTKDGTKADLTLNLYARWRALKCVRETGRPVVYCSISCCIGSPDIELAFYDEHNNQFEELSERRGPRELIELFDLRKPRFAEMCMRGLFSKMPVG